MMLNETSTFELTIQMPVELQQQTQHLAIEQGETISAIIHHALEYYIDLYKKPVHPVKTELSLEQGRNLMRELGLGLGNSKAPHNVARNHDLYLYQK